MNIENFDKIWCLHCVDHFERYECSRNEFNKVGILDRVEYRWTSLQPKVNLLMSDKLNHLRTEAEYHCTREHYTMIKMAYLLGYDYIMIFEDDCKLIKKEYWDLFMNNIPDDFDILRFGGCPIRKDMKNNYIKLFDKNIYWARLIDYLWTTTGYALSRKGMKYYIGYVNSGFVVADMPLFNMTTANEQNLNVYISTLPITYYHKFQSSIQPAEDFDLKDTYYLDIDTTIYD